MQCYNLQWSLPPSNSCYFRPNTSLSILCHKCLQQSCDYLQAVITISFAFHKFQTQPSYSRGMLHKCYDNCFVCSVHNNAANSHPWCRSAHTCLIDPDINDTSRIVTVCLRPTPTDNLPILAYIHLADLCHNEATLSLGRRAIECTCTARITNGMRLGEQTHKTPHFHSQHRHPPSRYDLPKKSLGLAQPPSHQCRTFPFLLVQMGYGLLCGLWMWRRRTNRRPCCPRMSNPSISSWTARPYGSGRWDNRMAAQHLPRNLARPSCG